MINMVYTSLCFFSIITLNCEGIKKKSLGFSAFFRVPEKKYIFFFIGEILFLVENINVPSNATKHYSFIVFRPLFCGNNSGWSDHTRYCRTPTLIGVNALLNFCKKFNNKLKKRYNCFCAVISKVKFYDPIEGSN